MLKDAHFFKLLKNDNPNSVGELLLISMIESCNAENGCLYLLDRNDNCFSRKYYDNPKEFPPKLYNNDIKSLLDINNIGTFNNSKYSKSKNELFIPLLKDSPLTNKEICIGILYFKGVKECDNTLINHLEEKSILFVKVISDLFIINLLVTINQSINFKKPRDEYFEDLLLLLSDASSFPLIAIRELDIETGALEVVGHFGFDKNLPPDFSKDKIPPDFLKVLNEKSVVQTLFNERYAEFEGLKNLDISYIIILPIVVGDIIWGILSLASRSEYFLNYLELTALESVSHGIGISISNYNNYNISTTKLFDIANSATLISGLEIAQAVRHEAQNQLEELGENVFFLYKSETDKNKKEELKYISKKIGELNATIQKFKTVTKPPVKELSLVNIKHVWEEAYDTFRGRLEFQNIRVKINPNLNIQINAYKDWLRHAFLNLLLNSLDSFKDRGKKGGKEINISLDYNTEESHSLRFLYIDNAGGIDPTKLAIPEELKERYKDDIYQVIFEKNVTSKGDSGSGFGLFLIRTIIQDYHNGTIKLINYRNGVTFSIELSKKIE